MKFSLVIIIATAHLTLVSSVTLSITDECPSNGYYDYTFYGNGPFEFTLAGSGNREIDNCKWNFFKPANSRVALTITYATSYNVGINSNTKQPMDGGRGLKLYYYDAASNHEFPYIGNRSTFWSGLSDGANLVVGTPLPPSTLVHGNSWPSVVILTLEYRGTIPHDRFVMTVSMSCGTAPCPTGLEMEATPTTRRLEAPTSPKYFTHRTSLQTTMGGPSIRPSGLLVILLLAAAWAAMY